MFALPSAIRVFACGAVAAALLSGAAAPARAADAKTIAAAKKEGEVVWYTTLIVKQVVRPMVAAFEKKYPGIRVRYTRANATTTAVKIMNEARAGKVAADVFDGTSTEPPLEKAGLVAKWVPSEAKNYPPEYKDKDGYWVAGNLYFLTPGYNTNLVKKADAPKTLDDLLDPKWKGKMVWNASSTSSGPGFIGNILTSMGAGEGDGLSQEAVRPEDRRHGGERAQGARHRDRRRIPDRAADLQPPCRHQRQEGRAGRLDPDGARDQPGVHRQPAQGGAASQRGQAADRLHPVRSEGQKVFQKANYLPALPSVPAKVPSLKPKEGGFKANVLTPSQVAAELPKWKKIFNELFR